MKITDEFLAGLEAKAKAATQGKWEICHVFNQAQTSWWTIGISVGLLIKKEVLFEDGNLEFIAAAQPAHILALIAELREARQTIDIFREDMADYT